MGFAGRGAIILAGFVEAGLLRVEERKRRDPQTGRDLVQHVGGAGEIHVGRSIRGRVHGNAAAKRNYWHSGSRGRISTTKVGGIEHALVTAGSCADLAGEELGVPVRHRLKAVGVGGEGVDRLSLVAGSGGAGDVGVLNAVDGESGDYISAIAGEIGGIGEIVNDAGDWGQGERTEESVGTAHRAWLGEGVTGGGKVGRSGGTGNIDIAAGVDSDSRQAVNFGG